tara:strand:- start:1039 stop:1587 length:549 start_codon:yes stop_codon:yes gene_type:complete
MRSFNSKNVNKKDLEKKLSFTKKANINGQTIDMTTEETKYRIMSGMKKLEEKGLATYSSDAGDDSLANDSLALLSAIGVTVDTSLTRDIDLKDFATDTEVVENPNIQDKDFKNMKGQQIDGTDKFPDKDNSFYELDNKKRQYQDKSTNSVFQKSDLAIQKMAADISFVNLNPKYATKLSEFK